MRTSALILFLASLASGAGGFRVVDSGPRGRISGTAYHDLDGDGRQEILLFRGHRLEVCAPDASGSYDFEHPQVLDLDPDAICYDLGQADDVEKTHELAVLSPAGVKIYRVEKGRLSPKARLLLPARTLASRGAEGDLRWRGFLRDLDGDGLPDLVLPAPRGFALYYQRRDPEGRPGTWPGKPDRLLPYTLRSTLVIGKTGLLGRLHATVGVPDFRVEDFTGDGKPDFAMDSGRRLRIYPAGEDGRITREASREIDLSPLADTQGSLPPITIRDVNGDGLPDFLTSHRKKGITDIFLGGGSFERPDQRIKIPGWAFEPRLCDLDGDGRVDLIIPSTPKVDNLTTAMSVWATHAISVNNRIFLNTGDPKKPYGKEPDEVREIRVTIRLYVDLTGNIKAAHSVLVNYDADFNGDGRRDLLYREGTDEILIFFGRKEGVISRSPAVTLEIPDTEGCPRLAADVRDLNGDGRPDVALRYESRDRRGDRLVLLLSTKPGGK